MKETVRFNLGHCDLEYWRILEDEFCTITLTSHKFVNRYIYALKVNHLRKMGGNEF